MSSPRTRFTAKIVASAALAVALVIPSTPAAGATPSAVVASSSARGSAPTVVAGAPSTASPAHRSRAASAEGHPAAASGVSAGTRPYLVLGDSISAGYQPDRGDDRRGGYPRTVAAGMRRAGTPVRITNLACTGEDSVTMRRGGRCRYREGSQQRAALAFLRAHPDTALVTVSLGANDLLRCADRRRGTADSRCVARHVRDLRPRLARTLTELRRAAPHARFVVLDYYDPFQAATVLTPATRGRGATAGLVRTQVNMAVRGAARDADARVAYVTDPFDTGWARRVDLPGHGRVPIRVARICTWTWMCSRGDIHPNDRGHRVIGGAVLAAVQRRR